MPPDPNLSIRKADTWDTATVIDVTGAAFERSQLAWWLHPRPATRAPSIREHLRSLTGRPAGQIMVRVIVDDEAILAGAAWTTCTGQHPPADLIIPGSHPHRSR